MKSIRINNNQVQQPIKQKHKTHTLYYTHQKTKPNKSQQQSQHISKIKTLKLYLDDPAYAMILMTNKPRRVTMRSHQARLSHIYIYFFFYFQEEQSSESELPNPSLSFQYGGFVKTP